MRLSAAIVPHTAQAQHPALPVDARHPVRHDEHLAARPPLARIDNELDDAPGVHVDDEIVHRAGITIAGLDAVADDLTCAAQVRLGGLLFLDSGRLFGVDGR
jgi:hypothetical protein